MDNKLTLDDVAHFSWGWNHQFFLETAKGNYIWSDPDYSGGNNTIIKFDGTHNDWLRQIGVNFSRDKGRHTIRGYCGEEVKIQSGG